MIILQPDINSAKSLADQITDALEHGVGWIQLPTAQLDDIEAERLTQTAIDLCRTHDVILTIENHVETVNRQRNHGTMLKKGSMHPAFVRERLGPHAIIGVEITPDYDLTMLRRADIDYAVLSANFNLTDADIVAEKLSDLGIEIPLVITGQYTPQQLQGHKIRGILQVK